jgi:hypothetical protein
MPPRRRTPARLLHSVLILAPLIPGGPIETRILAEYPIWAIASFNLVISVIVLAALPLAWIGRRGGRRVAIGSVLDGAGFTAIYALDMLKIFPVSETPMSPTLRVMAFARQGRRPGHPPQGRVAARGAGAWPHRCGRCLWHHRCRRIARPACGRPLSTIIDHDRDPPPAARAAYCR